MRSDPLPCFLATLALLALTSCGSSAVKSPTGSSASVASSPTSSPDVLTVAANSSLTPLADHSTPTSEAQDASPSAVLSPGQIAQLAKLDVDVFLPTYLPPGFQVANFKAYRQQNPQDRTDYSYYTVSYRGTDNTCIEVGSGYQAMWITDPTTTQVETPVGAVKVSSGKYRGTETLQHWAEIGTRKGQAVFTGGRIAGQACNPVSMAEYTKVLKSLERLQPIASQPPDLTTSKPSPDRSRGLTATQQVALKALGIPVVIPAYVPPQFQVSKVITNSCGGDGPRTGACREGPNYTIVYRNPQNACLVVNAIGGGIGGGVSEFEFRTESALLGEVFILFGKTSGTNQSPTPEQLRTLQPNLSSFPASLKSRSRSPFYNVVSGDYEYYQTTYQCGQNTSITPLELEKVVQSLILLE